MDYCFFYFFLFSLFCCVVFVLCCVVLMGWDEMRWGGVLFWGGEDDDNDSIVVFFFNVFLSFYWRLIVLVFFVFWYLGIWCFCIFVEEVKLKKCGLWFCILFYSLCFFIGIVVWRLWSGDGNREIRVLNFFGGFVF